METLTKNGLLVSEIKDSYRKRDECINPKFINVECPSCTCTLAYVVWYKDSSVGCCPDCGEEWTEPGKL